MQLLSNIFYEHVVEVISSTPTVASQQTDILRWVPSRTGACTTKEIYKTLSRANTIQLPHQGSRSIHPQCNLILRRAWKSKDHPPPLIKTFIWRLIRQALATAERVGRYTHSDQHRDTCGVIETDSHLFFHCSLPLQVWNSHSP